MKAVEEVLTEDLRDAIDAVLNKDPDSPNMPIMRLAMSLVENLIASSQVIPNAKQLALKAATQCSGFHAMPLHERFFHQQIFLSCCVATMLENYSNMLNEKAN